MENKVLSITFRKLKHLERLSKYNHNLFEVETDTNCKFILEEFTDEQEKIVICSIGQINKKGIFISSGISWSMKID